MGTSVFSLDAAGNLIGKQNDHVIVYDITDGEVHKILPKLSERALEALVLMKGTLQIGEHEVTFKGENKGRVAFTIPFVDIKAVERFTDKKLETVRIKRNDGRVFQVLNSWDSKTSSVFSAFVLQQLTERITKERLERQQAEETRETVKQEKTAVMDAARIEKLKKLVQVSKKLKIAQMAQILDLSEKELYNRIVDWAAEFGFQLDEDVIEFGAGRKDDFIASLDNAFADWGKKDQTKEGKI